MKIAFFSDTYLPNTDGVVTYLTLYRRELEKRGHEVFIFAPGNKKAKDENRDPKVHYFTSTTFKPYPDYRIALFPFISGTNLIKAISPDIVHSHGVATTGIAAFQAAHKIGVPCAVTFHTMVAEASHYVTKGEAMQDVFQKVAWTYLKWYFSNFDKVIAPSAYAGAVLSKNGINGYAVMPAGLDLSRFRPDVEYEHVKKQHGIDGPVVLFVGRLVLEKNLLLLIDAAQKVINKRPGAKFMIGGTGPAEQYYKDLVKQKGLSDSFIFLGYVDAATLPALYRASDAFAFPSFFDTQGFVVLEALASGTPVVVPKNSAPAEFVQDGVNGFLFSDAQDFPEKILAAMDAKESISAKVSESAGRYELGRCVDELLQFYESLLKAKKKPPSI
jgi:1,2-diacylglycerol 3-alpha-glucosyltransferase